MNDDLLRQRLRSMFQDATARPGRNVRHVLKNGLHLAMKVQQRDGGSVLLHLGLARRGEYPSPTEWRVVVERLPDLVPPLGEPEQAERNGWCWLYGCVELPPLETRRIDLNDLLRERERAWT